MQGPRGPCWRSRLASGVSKRPGSGRGVRGWHARKRCQPAKMLISERAMKTGLRAQIDTTIESNRCFRPKMPCNMCCFDAKKLSLCTVLQARSNSTETAQTEPERLPHNHRQTTRHSGHQTAAKTGYYSKLLWGYHKATPRAQHTEAENPQKHTQQHIHNYYGLMGW